MHYSEKREALALLAGALQDLGWKLYGYHKDASDMMTDYYAPASWHGVAVKGDAIICAGVTNWNVQTDSGKPIIKRGSKPGATCERCKGSGDDPSGWTLEQARKSPRDYKRAHLVMKEAGGIFGPGAHAELAGGHSFSLAPAVVSPVPFHRASAACPGGVLRCVTCHGNGHELVPTEEQVDTWPVFQANPGRSSWHVERGGAIIAKGTGIYSKIQNVPSADCRTEDGMRKQNAALFAAKLDAAATGKPKTKRRRKQAAKVAQPKAPEPSAPPAPTHATFKAVTDDERALMTHISLFGSLGYPVHKVGDLWAWGPWRSIKRAPSRYRTKRAATNAFENYLAVLRRALGEEAYQQHTVEPRAPTGPVS